MLATRDFSNADDMLAFYASLKKRLYAPPAPIARIPPPPPKAPEAVNLRVHHDSHVWRYHAYAGDFSTPAKMRGTRIIQETAHRYGIKPQDITGPSRAPFPILARHEAVWRIQNELKWPLAAIGRAVNRDHSTVLNGIRRHTERLKLEDPDVISFKIRTRPRTIYVHQIADVLRMSRIGRTEAEIAIDLGLRPSHVRYARRCYLGKEIRS